VVWRDRSRLRALVLLALLLNEVEVEVDGSVGGGCYRCRFSREGSWFIPPSGINFGMSDEAVLFVWEISRQNKRHSVSEQLLRYNTSSAALIIITIAEILKTPLASMYA